MSILSQTHSSLRAVGLLGNRSSSVRSSVELRLRTAIVILTAVFALAAVPACEALPTLGIDFVQSGNDCSFNWWIDGATAPNSGATLHVEGLFLGNNTGNFLGWWTACTSTLGGSVADGWTDFPIGGVDDATGYIPNPSSRFAGIFAVGVHSVGVTLYTDPTRPPGLFTPDGPSYGGASVSFTTSFEVKSVPETASTLVLCGAFAVGVLAIAACRPRRYSGVLG